MAGLNLDVQMAFAFGLFYPIADDRSNIDRVRQRNDDAIAASTQRGGTQDVSVKFCNELGKLTFDVMMEADKNVDPKPAFLNQFRDMQERL
jgi:hypothetical protein